MPYLNTCPVCPAHLRSLDIGLFCSLSQEQFAPPSTALSDPSIARMVAPAMPLSLPVVNLVTSLVSTAGTWYGLWRVKQELGDLGQRQKAWNWGTSFLGNWFKNAQPTFNQPFYNVFESNDMRSHLRINARDRLTRCVCSSWLSSWIGFQMISCSGFRLMRFGRR